MSLPLKPYRPPLEPRLSLLHVDEALIAADKPAGLLSVPGRTEPDCLEARVREAFPEALTVHRLDMATSGVMLFARSKEALAHLGKQFEKRMTRKRYIAVVEGRAEADRGTVDAPLRCDWPNRPLQMICQEHGRPAVTHWQVLERRGETTRLALTPVTGRSHQLRVHMASIGHPILGDEWYGDERAAPRLLLHAEELRVRHPVGGREMVFASKVPF